MLTDEIDLLALERQVCFALSVASRSVITMYRSLLEPMGLTHPQYLVMLALWGREPLSVKELSGLLKLDAGTLSPLLKRLETAGLLSRERKTSDERHLDITLTAHGRALRAQAEQIPPQVMSMLGMDMAELQQLHASLTRVINASISATALTSS